MQTTHFRGSVKNKLRAIIVLVVFMSATLGYGSFIYWFLNNQQEKAIELSRSVGLVLGQDFAKLLLLGELSAASDITTKLKSFSTLNSLVLYDAQSHPSYQYHKEDKGFTPKKTDQDTPFFANYVNSNKQILMLAEYEGVELGKIDLHFEIDSIFILLKRDSIFLLSLVFFMFFVSYILAEIFAKRFTAPILDLVSFLENIELSTLSRKKIHTDQKNEFGKLYHEINTMLLRLYKAQEDQKIAAVAFNTQSGMIITDAHQKILRINKALTDITGYTQEEVLGKTPNILSSGQHSHAFYEEMHRALKKGHYWSSEIYNRHKNGDIYPQHLTIQTVVNEMGEIKYYVATILDLTLQKNAEKRIDFLNTHDALTHLANKDFLTKKLQDHLSSDSSIIHGALFCVDFTNFKLINDAHGHFVGDEVLKSVAQRVRTKLTKASLHARIGADEFVLWYIDISKNKDNAPTQATLIAEEIVALLSQPYKVYGKTIHSIPCVGITFYNNANKSAANLIQEANAALHLAKVYEHSNIAFFDTNTEVLAKRHLSLYTELLLALEEQHFELLYQGQFDQNGKIYGAEALIRWNDPHKGVISPLEFISIAEKTSFIIPLGLWILQTATKQLALWQRDKRTAHMTLAVNISAKQFYQEDFVSIIETLIEKNALVASKLKLELTESLFIKDIESLVLKMQELRSIGVSLSLDDFGTGYSSLEYLKKLPLDQIKIDQSFVKNMLENSSDIAIIKTIISLAEAFELEVIAEGVETQVHHETLVALGCKAFQGYYFAKPQRAEELIKYLE